MNTVKKRVRVALHDLQTNSFFLTHNPLAFLKQAILASFPVPLTKPLSDWKPLHNVIQKVGGASALTARAGCLR